MMITVNEFHMGLNKALPPRYLKENQAAELKDVNCTRGILESEKSIKLVNVGVKGFYAANFFADSGINRWFTHNNPMIYIDYQGMVYKSSANELERPKRFDAGGNDLGELGIDNPTTLPSVAEDTSKSTFWKKGTIFSYVYTYKKGYAESAPSPVANIELDNDNVAVKVTTPTAAAAGADKIRIYRAGNGVTDYLLLTEFDGGDFVDTKENIELGDACDTWNNDKPPNGLILDGYFNGRLFGHVEREAILRFSRVVDFDSWSSLDTIRFDSRIMKAVNYHGSIVVLCRSEVYQLVGTEPDEFTKVSIPTEHACVSEYSPIVANNALFWQADDGIAMFDGATVSIISKNVLPKSYFSGRKLRSGAKDGVVYFGDENGIISVDLENGGVWREYSSVENFGQFFYNKADDKLYISTNDGLYAMFEGDPSRFIYLSPLYGNDEVLKHFRSIRIIGDGKFDIALICDGLTVAEYNKVDLDKYEPKLLFYPRFNRAYTTQVRISGVGSIYSYSIEVYPQGVKANV